MDGREARLLDALGALRADLLRGDLGGLEAHLAAVSSLGDDLASGGHRPAALAALRAEADRTRDVLSAAACGVRAALRRLEEASAPAAVYAADGRRIALAAPPPKPGSHG
jgi:hypothetical protein